MILSVSRRTDIPCHYAHWFMHRIRAGYALTRNPMNHAQLFSVPLTPDLVDCIVFWTKDPAGILPALPELDRLGYRYYFQFTLTPYGKDIEPGLRGKGDIADTFIRLSEQIGRQRVVWRYDPILLSGGYDIAFHKEQFWQFCQRLHDYTDTVTISFFDYYAKLKNLELRELRQEEIAELGSYIGETTRQFGLRAVSCCEAVDLSAYGIGHASCIDAGRIREICGSALAIPRDRAQRPGCGCCESIDIGSYDSCTNGCVYCYANRGTAAALRRQQSHDPQSPLLIGTVQPGEIIRPRNVKSYR